MPTGLPDPVTLTPSSERVPPTQHPARRGRSLLGNCLFSHCQRITLGPNHQICADLAAVRPMWHPAPWHARSAPSGQPAGSHGDCHTSCSARLLPDVACLISRAGFRV